MEWSSSKTSQVLDFSRSWHVADCFCVAFRVQFISDWLCCKICYCVVAINDGCPKISTLEMWPEIRKNSTEYYVTVFASINNCQNSSYWFRTFCSTGFVVSFFRYVIIHCNITIMSNPEVLHYGVRTSKIPRCIFVKLNAWDIVPESDMHHHFATRALKRACAH